MRGRGRWQEERSTLAHPGPSPVGASQNIVIRDNNKQVIGYGIECLLHSGDWEFNEIQPWRYHELPLLVAGGTGYEGIA